MGWRHVKVEMLVGSNISILLVHMRSNISSVFVFLKDSMESLPNVLAKERKSGGWKNPGDGFGSGQFMVGLLSYLTGLV